MLHKKTWHREEKNERFTRTKIMSDDTFLFFLLLWWQQNGVTYTQYCKLFFSIWISSGKKMIINVRLFAVKWLLALNFPLKLSHSHKAHWHPVHLPIWHTLTVSIHSECTRIGLFLLNYKHNNMTRCDNILDPKCIKQITNTWK